MRKNFKTNNKKAMPTTPLTGPLRQPRRVWAGRIEASRKGFSFLEVMVVIFILGTSLVVFIQVISKSIGHSTASRDMIIASELAQEGAELVRNIRDNNWIKAKTNPLVTAFTGINNTSSGSVGSVNYDVVGLDYGVSGGEKLKWNDNNGYSYYSVGSNTRFSRIIKITGDSNTKTITSMVIWDGSVFPLSVTSCNVANKCVYAEITLTKWAN